jgi:hypothetical protein
MAEVERFEELLHVKLDVLELKSRVELAEINVFNVLKDK